MFIVDLMGEIFKKSPDQPYDYYIYLKSIKVVIVPIVMIAFYSLRN